MSSGLFFLQMFPAIPPYMLQPQFGMPNAPAQLPQQFPFQPYGVFNFLCDVYIYTHQALWFEIKHPNICVARSEALNIQRSPEDLARAHL